MMIIMNEREYIEDMIKNKDLGYSPFKTISMVARYYYSLGYKPRMIREELEHFMIRCDSDINLVKWSSAIDKAVLKAKERPLIEINGIHITQKELEVCKSAGASAFQRLAFTALCLAKYFNAVSGKNNGWVNTKMKNIFSLADIKTSKKRQAYMIGNLVDKGLFRLSNRIDNTNIQVLFIDEEGSPVLTLDDMDNLGLQYERFIFGEKDYPKCIICGKIFRRKGPKNVRPKVYCKECFEETVRKRAREWKLTHDPVNTGQ